MKALILNGLGLSPFLGGELVDIYESSGLLARRSSPHRRLRVEGQVEVLEYLLGPLVDRQSRHPGTLHHRVEGREVLLL